MNKENEERALRLHKNSIIIDALTFAAAVTGHEYFDKLIGAGVTAAGMTVPEANDTPLQAIGRLKTWYDLFDEHSKIVQVTTARDIEKAKREGKFGVIMGTQNAAIIGDDLGLLSVYQRLGFRVIQLTYQKQNLLGEGCGERTDKGLSMFGVEAVEEMNRLGLLIDISHCGDQVTMDAIRLSKEPIVATHANARGLVNHIRNKTDEVIKALAEKGGVIGLIAFSTTCEVRKGLRPTLEDLLEMADYIVRLVGSDHVGLGLDLSPFKSLESWATFERLYPELKPAVGGFYERNIFTTETGEDDVTQFPEIVKGLVSRGYSDQDIEKILGLNFLRVYREVWGE